MFILYDLAFILFALICLPAYLLKGKLKESLLSRLGFLLKDVDIISRQKPLWLHAVSVGEVMAARPLIELLRERFPSRKLVISTVTSTGNKVAKSLAKVDDLIIYLPFDISFITRAFVKRINPCYFIAMETEIWPNLISALHSHGVPIFLVNGRISTGSFKGYKIGRFFLEPILEKIDLFCMQTQSDADRIIFLGAPQERVRVIGNTKFDAVKIETDKSLLARLSIEQSDKVLVLGSTHEGEEEMLFSHYKKLKEEFPFLKLVIAPRHVERAEKIEKLILSFGMKPVRVSLIKGTPDTKESIFILDTIGQLASIYSIADIVFVGGSLVKKGGHNIIEPAIFSKPIIFGPFMSNFADIADLFLNDNAAIKINSPEEFYFKVKELLQDSNRSKELGRRAISVVEKNKGATKRALTYLNERIPL